MTFASDRTQAFSPALPASVWRAAIGSVAAHATVAVALSLALLPHARLPEPPEAGVEMVFEAAPAPQVDSAPEPAPAAALPDPAPAAPPVPESPPVPEVAEPPPPLPESAPPSPQNAAPLPPADPVPPPPPRPPRARPSPVKPEAPRSPAPHAAATSSSRPTAAAPPASMLPGPRPDAAPGPPAALPAPAPPAAGTEVSPAWRSALGAWLQSHKVYPDEARRQGIEGRVVVRFTVDRDGRVLSVQLAGSSGAAVLDDAVRTMLQGARLPAFPAAMAQAQQTITLGIQYNLER